MATVFDPNSANQANNQQKQDDQQSNSTQLQTVATAAPAAQATSSQGPAASSKPQGSGRFTNIQKYLQANQSGGQNIANKIGGNITSEYDKAQQKAQQYNQQLNTSVSNANQVAQQGQQYTQQLQGIGSDINAATTAGFDQRNNQNFDSINNFVNDPNFGQFQNIQSGRAIDENLLANQQQRLYQQAQAAAEGVTTAQQQLGNESGRFELLRKAFGGSARPGYSQGQQRLDQVLLGQGGGLGQVQQEVGLNARNAQQQARSAAEQANEVSRITAQEQGLIGDINTTSSANEKAYIDMLTGFVDPLNQQRNDEFNKLGSALDTYIPTYDEKTKKYTNKAYQPGLDADQMAKLGITDNNTGVYNTFKDSAFQTVAGDTPEARQANLARIIANKGADASGFQDVANQTDVNRYAALAKIMGKSDPRLTQASTLGDAYTSKTDSEGGLKGRLDAQQKMYEEAAKKNLTVKGPTYGEQIYATPEELLAQGRNAVNFYDPDNSSPMKYGDAKDVWSGAEGKVDAIKKLYQDFLNQQNYNQTIGGTRETFLDSENPSKLNNTPITGYDPSKSGNK